MALRNFVVVVVVRRCNFNRTSTKFHIHGFVGDDRNFAVTKWQWNGWTNSKGEDVANQDLWIDIIPYFDNFWYHFSKVKGHGSNYWNNECDRLAQIEAQRLKDNFKGEENI